MEQCQVLPAVVPVANAHPPLPRRSLYRIHFVKMRFDEMTEFAKEKQNKTKNKTKWNEIIFGIHLPPPPPLCFFFLINNFSFFLFYDEFVLVFLNVLFVVFIPSKLSSPPNGFCCYIISQLLLWFSINSHQNVVVSSFSSVDIISELCWRTTQTQKKETLTNETRETLMAPGHVLVFVGLAKSVEKNGCERD